LRSPSCTLYPSVITEPGRVHRSWIRVLPVVKSSTSPVVKPGPSRRALTFTWTIPLGLGKGTERRLRSSGCWLKDRRKRSLPGLCPAGDRRRRRPAKEPTPKRTWPVLQRGSRRRCMSLRTFSRSERENRGGSPPIVFRRYPLPTPSANEDFRGRLPSQFGRLRPRGVELTASSEWRCDARHSPDDRTFLRRFKAATGTKPTKYSQCVRMEKARELLQFTRRTVDQIAWSVGYEDAAAFRRVFGRLVGLSPGDYRRRFGADHEVAVAA
jgi:Helix-turn-helix domain